MTGLSCCWLACALFSAALLDVTFARLRQKRNEAENVPHGKKLHEFITDVGPGKETDLVLLLDRSHGMHREYFYQYVRGYTMQLLLRYAVIHPDYTRVAVVTFAKDTEIVFDYITTNNPTTCHKGHIFYSSSPPIDNILFYVDPAMSQGTNMAAGFQVVQNILNAGKIARPSASQVVMVMSDGAYESGGDPLVQVSALKSAGVKIYAFGLGVWLRSGNVREIATSVDHYGEKTHTPPFDHFQQLLELNPRGAWTSDTPPVWVVSDVGLCPGACGGQLCATNALTGNSICMCGAGYEPMTQNDTFIECKECGWHHYKPEQGNMVCTPCPAHHVTDSMGNTAKTDCYCPAMALTAGDCDANTISLVGTCDPVCSENAFCRDYAVYGQCFCKDGYEGYACGVNVDNCPSQSEDAVCGKGVCLDGVDLYSCACPLGYMGKNCEMDVDECAMGVCDNNSTCTDGENSWVCTCHGLWKGDSCQDAIVTTTQAPEVNITAGNLTSQVPVNSGLSEFWIIVIAAVAGGVVFVFLVVCITVTCVMQKRRKKAEKEAAEARLELDTLKRERKGRGSSLRRYRKTLTQTLSQAFSGFWKRKSLRGEDSFAEGNYDTEGFHNQLCSTPSAPPRQRPDILGGSEAINANEEVVIDVPTNKRTPKAAEEASSGMEGWQAYLRDLATSDIIVGGAICDVDSEKHAVTPHFAFSQEEMHRLHDLLIGNKRDSTVAIQSYDFFIDDNDGVLAHGQTTSDAAVPHVVYIGRTRKFLVILMAADDGAHALNVKKELKWIVDHISGEGY